MNRRVSCAFVFILTATAAQAAVLSWSTAGPETGSVSVVRFAPSDPQVVYAGGQLGVFRSVDAGRTWAFAGSGIIGRVVDALAVDPTNPSIAYAGSPLGTIYKTADGGASWTSVSSGLFPGNAPIRDIAIDPSSPSTLYAATHSAAVFPSLGVQKSTNGGQTWTDAGANGLGTKNVYAVAIDRNNPSVIYAGGLFDNSDRPLFKSTNGGASWVPISSGVPALSVDAIGVDPTNGNTLFIGQATGLRKSTNGGTSWGSGGSGLGFSIAPQVIVYEPGSSTNIWVASLSDIYRSTDGGSTWTAAKIANKRVRGLAVSSDRVVIAGTEDSGLYRRTSADSTWTPSNSGFLASQVLSLAADRNTDGVLFAGTNRTGLFKSTDHGRSWQVVLSNLNAIGAVAIDPRNSATVYAAVGGSVYRSRDNGTTWSLLTIFTEANSIAVDPLVADVIYVGTDTGVRKGTGSNFTSVSTGLPSGDVVALAVDPGNSSTVYAGIRGQGFFKTTDGGASWTKKSTGMTDPDVVGIVIDPTQPSVVYAATDGGGVFKSSNGAENWTESNSGLPSTRLTRALAMNSADPRTLYASTTSSGVFQSTDAGATWTPLGGASPAANLASLVVEKNGFVIHTGSTSGGVWSYQLRAFDPTLRVSYPLEGATIANGTPVLTVVENFTLDCSTSGESGQGRGHIRIEVDGALDTTGCASNVRLTKTYSLGSHRITVSLRNPDGSALSPAVSQTVNVTVAESEPTKRRRGVRR